MKQSTMTLTPLYCAVVCAISLTPIAQAHSYSEQLVSQHKLDCTIIRPWAQSPANHNYPIILWANGWGNKNTDVTAGYKPGLIEWATSGNFIVVAANARSPRERDPLACVAWILDQNQRSGSIYYGKINTQRAGLAGHSQGGGVMINADTVRAYFDYTAVLALTPYAANWPGASNQQGPVMLLAGGADEVAPVSNYALPAWQQVQQSRQGGLLAIAQGADHNTDAWGPAGQDPTQFNFGQFQYISELWWQLTLNQDQSVGATLKTLLDNSPWTTEYQFSAAFQLP